MAAQGAWVQIFPGHHGGSKNGVVFAPPPPLFEGPKCLRGVGVKDCTWAPPMTLKLCPDAIKTCEVPCQATLRKVVFFHDKMTALLQFVLVFLLPYDLHKSSFPSEK